jgi:hypothetical protein
VAADQMKIFINNLKSLFKKHVETGAHKDGDHFAMFSVFFSFLLPELIMSRPVAVLSEISNVGEAAKNQKKIS